MGLSDVFGSIMCIVLQTIAGLSVLFHLYIVLSTFLQFTLSCYPLGIYERFYLIKRLFHRLFIHFLAMLFAVGVYFATCILYKSYIVPCYNYM